MLVVENQLLFIFVGWRMNGEALNLHCNKNELIFKRNINVWIGNKSLVEEYPRLAILESNVDAKIANRGFGLVIIGSGGGSGVGNQGREKGGT